MTSRAASPLLAWIALGSVGGALVGAFVVTATLLIEPEETPPPPSKRPTISQSRVAPPRTVADPDTYVIKRALKIDHRMRHGDWVWDDRGVAPGAVLVTVDLKAQMMSIFRGGYEIGVAVIEHGADDKPTPLGAFPILEKDADHVSSRYDGPNGRPAPMPWAMRLTRDGVFIHGAKVRPDWASNGCVGIPDDFAKKLFAVARTGDLVVITSGRVMKVGDSFPAT